MSPVANMAGEAAREIVRMAEAPAWNAWADSRSARATTATDFISLRAPGSRQELIPCANCKVARACAEQQCVLKRVLTGAGAALNRVCRLSGCKGAPASAPTRQAHRK